MAARGSAAGWFGEVDALLRSERTLAAPVGGHLSGPGALLFVILGGGIYGAVMATFALTADRSLLVLYGAIKVPVLFGVTMLLAMPAFYVLGALRGVGDDFRTVFRMLVEYQMRVVVVLVALVPLTAFFNISAGVSGYAWMQLWNTFAFALAALLAQRKLAIAYRPLISRDPRHRLLLGVWTLLYGFIGIQMGWTLRPFIGQPGTSVAFIRSGEVDNAYVELFRLFSGAFGF